MICAAMLATAVSVVSLQAQPALLQQNAVDKLHKAVASLKLTDDEKAKLKPVFADAKSKGAAIRADKSLTPDQKKTQGNEMMVNLRSQVNAVLTPEQQARLKIKLHEERP